MTLFDRNRFCKVAGFINVTALIKRNVIGVNLERHYLQRGNKQRVGLRNVDNLLRLPCDFGMSLGSAGDNVRSARLDLLNIA